MEGRKLRIAMLTIHSSPIGELGTKDTGGMSVYIRELARVMGRRSHKIDIFTRIQNPEYDPMIQLYPNVRLIHLKAGDNGHLPISSIYPHLGSFYRELERFRTREQLQYDLIHSHYWLSGQVGKWLQDRWKAPHVVMFHTLGALKNMTVHEERESELRIAMERDLVQNCHRIVAATEKEREHFLRYYGAQPQKIGVVPCGVNLDLFRPMDVKAVRQRLGFLEDESIVLYVGRLAPLKGIDRLLEAVKYLKHLRPIRLVIIGGDGLHTRECLDLQRLSKELGVDDMVVFLGRIEHEELSPYYNSADVVVLPSHYETFGLVALEALASGTPVVATAVGAMESVIHQGETGCVVSNGSPRSLAAGIEDFLLKSRAGVLSADSIRASVLRFDWANVASAVLEQYAALLDQPHQHETAVKPVAVKR